MYPGEVSLVLSAAFGGDRYHVVQVPGEGTGQGSGPLSTTSVFPVTR